MVQMGGVPAWMCVQKTSNRARIINASPDAKKSRGFPRARVNDWILCLLIDLSCSTLCLCLMVSITTTRIYCIKVCLRKRKHHMVTPYHTDTGGLAIRWTIWTNGWETEEGDNFVFSFYPAVFGRLISSWVPDLSLLCSNSEERGLECSGCLHVSVCLCVSLSMVGTLPS